tara:strand:- start:339 stop:596 length:258 start_codon:yes stop_codon:yes gene_type:complete
MAKDQQMQMPGVFGGLMRYNDGYNSRFHFKPATIIVLIVVLAIAVISLKIFLPITPTSGGAVVPLPTDGGWIFLLLSKNILFNRK